MFQIPDDWFQDDDKQLLKIFVQFIGDTGIWLRYHDGASKTLLGEPALENIVYKAIVTATDEFGLTASSNLEIKILRNTLPRVIDP
jgi:hypothetical protein